ncbi:MAG TPA: VWA domain-containing protein, partial [Myxococcota bacterium]|nr:VWA domain-containing protein [Myxococcota bacterium]
MGFGNIGLLIGMALGVIPVIIHLINRRRAKLLRFAAIEFLLLSDKRLARRLKLKQLLVLALRVLLIAALAFALAKPYIEPDVAVGPDVSEPGAVVLLIDDSASMQAVDKSGETRLSRAIGNARALIEDGGPRTSFAIVAMGSPARLLTPGLTYDHAEASRALEKLGPSSRGADLQGALKEAGRILSESGERRRTVLALSDLAAHAWRPIEPWSWVPLSDVLRPSLGEEPEARENLALVDAVALEPGAPDEKGVVPMQVKATVQNFGVAERTARVELRLGAVAVAEVVVVPAGATKEATFKFEGAAGVTTGLVTLSADEGNALALDDEFYFTVGARRTLQVLLVNGSPRTTPYLDEVFFLRAAMAVTAPGETPITTSVVTPTELSQARIDASDVVVLANVGRLTKEQVVGLEQFVDKGGGLFISVGDEWSGEPTRMMELTQMYGRLLPYPVRELKSSGRFEDPRAVLSALTLSTADFSHPIFAVFDGLEDASLFKANTLSHVLLDTEGQPGAKVVASYTGGVPALVEAPLGRGRIVMLTTTVDRDWSDMALRTSFPPLMQRVVGYLARALERAGGAGFVVGEDVRAKVPDGNGPLLLVAPDGGERPLELTEDSPTVFVGAVETPGHYLVMRAGERSRALPFAVNAERRESDLTAAS